jgi:hypothetical protein
MKITESAARELIKSEYAYSKGLPSEAFLDQAMNLLRERGNWQLDAGLWITYRASAPGQPFERDTPELYELGYE